MEIKTLVKQPAVEQNIKLNRKFVQFEKLIAELNSKDLSNKIVMTINSKIDVINSFSGTDRALKKQISKMQFQTLKLVEKERKLVPKNHYRNTWLAIGMVTFGVPIGVAFSVSIGNMAFIGIGIPVGMVIGMAIGAGMDKKAGKEGRQLNIEIRS